MKSRHKKSLGFRQMLAAGAAVLSMTATALVPVPAYAQFGGIVYDPSNYSQNILTAARTLEQIHNQIRQLQIQQTQALIRQAQGMAMNVQQIEAQFATQYKSIDLTQSQRAMMEGAHQRWQTSVGAFEDALKVQAGVVSNIEGSRIAIDQLVTASQSATGALQAAQAGNQLLALQSQQMSDLIATVAAMGRAQSLDAANSAAAKAQAREQLRRFLATGRGYVPTSAQMYRN